VPVKALGDAIYNHLGLTFTGDLDAFWQESAHFKVDPSTVRRFIHALVVNSQVNGSFYRRIPGVTQQTGMCWRQSSATNGQL
jgi:capsular polysaccharide export protein